MNKEKLNDIYLLDNILYDFQHKNIIFDSNYIINYHEFKLSFSEYRNIIKNLILYENSNNIKYILIVINEILNLINKYKKYLNFIQLKGYFIYINNIE